MLDIFLENEISLNREAGTYLFYGEDKEKSYEIALEFSKELFTKNIKDNILLINEIKKKVARETYADLFIIDNLTIDTIRDLIKKTYTTSHEGNGKVFILKNIENIRKESANAILKVIEEPTKNNFFILISNRLNILSTIKSRSIVHKIVKYSPEDLEVDKYTYEFFSGSSTDIKKFKEAKLELSTEESFKNIGKFLKNYEINKNLDEKIKIYKALRNFLIESESLKKYEKIKFAEDIYNNISEKENIKLIVDYLINLVKKNKNLKNKLELKNMLRYPINIKLFFINLILEI
ncbi:MAG: ATPase [Fusobacterium sp.]|nr:ATPase [Fusobacterium sp.]